MGSKNSKNTHHEINIESKFRSNDQAKILLQIMGSNFFFDFEIKDQTVLNFGSNKNQDQNHEIKKISGSKP